MKSTHFNVLMVEDNPDHAFLTKQYLERNNTYSVSMVRTYAECFQALKNQMFDIILLDYNLPGEDGITILKRLKNKNKIDTPIVLVTGHGHEKIAVEAMKAGAFDYVIKTQDYPKILPGIIKSVIEKYQILEEKKRMENEISIRNQELHVLNALSEVLIQSLDLDITLKGTVEKITQLLDLPACAVYRWEPGTKQLILHTHKTSSPILDSFKEIGSESVEFFQTLIDEGRAVIFNNITGFHSKFVDALKRGNIAAFLFVPLKHKTEILGAVFVGCENNEFFTSRQIKLIQSICNQISMAIKNANLYSELSSINNKMENVVNSSLDLIITLREDGSLKFYNERFAKIYSGFNHNNNGNNILDYVPDKSKKLIKSKIEELKKNRSSIYETELLTPDNSNMPCIISQSPLKGRDEFLMIIKDISKIVNLQKQLIQADKLSALGQMISGVAHELNNPLAGILGFAQLMLEEELPENNRDDLLVICKEAKRCQNIVKNLLTFARKHNSRRQNIDVNEVLNGILDLQQYQLKSTSVTMIRNFEKDLPHIIGDYDQLQQVFLNLINNAKEALELSPKIDKRLEVRTRYINNVIQINIVDNGIGIPPEEKPRIFDPFFTTKEVGTGPGLGLSICFGIVQSHHGKIWVESELGAGSTFILEFSVMKKESISSAR